MDLLCLHADVGVPNSRYCPVSESELAGSGMDYAALGHVHKFSGLQRAGDCFWAYPGCPEGRGFDESGEKGAVIADVEPGRVNLRFVPLGTRRYEVLELDASELERFSLPEGAERNIYKITVTGETETPPDLAALRRRLEPGCFGLRLRDATLRGVFLRLLRERWEAAGDEAGREAVTRAARWGLAALDGGEEAEDI